MGRDRPLDDSDFPVKTDNEQIKSSDGDEIATAENTELAEDIADRLNDDAWRKHEENWSA